MSCRICDHTTPISTLFPVPIALFPQLIPTSRAHVISSAPRANPPSRLVGVGIARTIFLHRSQAETIDKGYVSYNALAAGTAECNVAIVCACAPSLKMLFGRYFRDLTTKSNSYQMGGSKNSNSKNSSRTPRFGGGARSAEISASGTVFSVGDGCGDGHGGAAETGGETESSKGIWRTMDVEMYNNSNEVLEPETISECGDGNSSLREGRGDTTAVVGETV